jgi:hypothetical protein
MFQETRDFLCAWSRTGPISRLLQMSSFEEKAKILHAKLDSLMVCSQAALSTVG